MNGVSKALSIMLVLGMFALNQQSFGQCNSAGVIITPVPQSLQFQFFPLSLLGIGEGGRSGNVGAFQRFGIEFNNTTGAPAQRDIQIGLVVGGESVFSQNVVVTLTIPPGTHFLSVSQFMNNEYPSRFQPQSPLKPKINKDFLKRLAGGLPSGRFEFPISIAVTGSGIFDPCGSIIAEVLTGATVDLIVPAHNSETSNLPLFQWSATGGNRFILTIARLKPRQTEEDALNTSSQRLVLELSESSYQLTAGGPSRARENNLTWNPGLADGEYLWRIAMIQEDPTTGSTNLVRSRIHRFSVKGGQAATALNTDQIIAILQTIPGLTSLDEQLKGYQAISIEIDGQQATADELRAKVKDLPEAYKVKTNW